ncbi:hypothetical protein ACOMHN_052229 [Nucella lapillus]
MGPSGLSSGCNLRLEFHFQDVCNVHNGSCFANVLRGQSRHYPTLVESKDRCETEEKIAMDPTGQEKGRQRV